MSKWDYPKRLTAKPRETSDMGTTDQTELRKERKKWRKKIKAMRHKALKAGKLDEKVGKWSVKKVKSYVDPYKMSDEELWDNDGNDGSYTKYHIKKNGKTVGRLRQDDYFGSMMARLGGNNMPELKHYGRNKKSGALSSLHAFMKSKTGKQWMARRKIAIDEVAPPGNKAERMVKHIKARYAKDGKLTKKEKAIAYATAWKAHNRGALEEAYRLGIKGRKLKKSELERVAKQYAQWKKVKDKKGKSAADEYLSNKAGPTTAINEISKIKARKALAAADEPEYENYKEGNRNEPLGDALLKRIKNKWGSKEADKAEYYSDTKNYPKKLAKQFARGRALGRGHMKESKMSDWAIDFEEKHGRKPSNDDLKRWHRLEKENMLQRKLNWKRIASRTGKVGRGGERD